MGKYMRKSKATGDVAVMEVSQAASLGVRTRAKTLALQRSTTSSASYLQLRSRRLQKHPPILPPREPRRQKHHHHHDHTPKQPTPENPNPPADEGSPEKEEAPEEEQNNNGENGDFGDAEEASFGENVPEFEGRERTTRESTPCSLIRDPDTIRTPGSTTRPTNSADANRRIQNSSQRHIPTAHDMDEFFAGAEEEQQKQFIDKYNYDPVNDKPLPGRYEWEKLDP